MLRTAAPAIASCRCCFDLTQDYVDDHVVPAAIICKWKVDEQSTGTHQSIPGSIFSLITYYKQPEIQQPAGFYNTYCTFWSMDKGIQRLLWLVHTSSVP